jgi:hypothetical protein
VPTLPRGLLLARHRARRRSAGCADPWGRQYLSTDVAERQRSQALGRSRGHFREQPDRISRVVGAERRHHPVLRLRDCPARHRTDRVDADGRRTDDRGADRHGRLEPVPSGPDFGERFPLSAATIPTIPCSPSTSTPNSSSLQATRRAMPEWCRPMRACHGAGLPAKHPTPPRGSP